MYLITNKALFKLFKVYIQENTELYYNYLAN